MKQFKKTMLVAIVSLAALSNQVYAQQTSPWSVGLGVINFDSPYKGVDEKVFVLPMVAYQGERLSIDGFAAEYRLTERGGAGLSVVLTPGGHFLDASDSDDAQVKQLSDRNLSVYAGIKASYSSELGYFSAALKQDISNNSKGLVATADYSYPIQVSSNLSITPALGVDLNSSKVANYYFGVAANELQNEAAYQLDKTLSCYVGVLATYNVSPSWKVNAYMRYKQLDDDIKRSPLIKDEDVSFAVLSVAYQF